MLKLLMRFLPEDKRLLLQLALRITSNLDTPEERKRAVEYGKHMLTDGRVSVGEWAKFGSTLGILRGKH